MADGWRRGALIVTAVSWWLAGACVRRLPVEGEELPRLAGYRERGEVVLVKDDRVVVVQAKDRPVLVVDGRRIALAEVRAEDVAGVQRAWLELRREDDGWRPRGAIGLTLAGPLGMPGWSGHWFPIDALAIDAGMFGAPHLGMAHAGVRVRPMRIGGRYLPYVGGFVHAGAANSPYTGQSEEWAAAGGRLGVDVELGARRRWLLGAEFDLVRPFGEDPAWVGEIEGRWLPWGGGHIGYQF